MPIPIQNSRSNDAYRRCNIIVVLNHLAKTSDVRMAERYFGNEGGAKGRGVDIGIVPAVGNQNGSKALM